MDLTLNSQAIPCAPFAIAFSGGGDSTALVHALSEQAPFIFIVDHGLRDGSEAEARAAQGFAQSLNLQTEILTWSPPPIVSGMQAKARRARYGLLGAACRARGLQYLLTGHTQNDQAETVLMRLKAGGNWRGGAGMRAVTPPPIWPELAAVDICRPMLSVGRADIRAYLKAHKLPYIDDPSNENRDFTRIRARDELAARPILRADMLALSNDMQVGRIYERQRDASYFKNAVTADEFGNLLVVRPIPPSLMALLIRAVSGRGEHPRADALTRLQKAIRASGFRGASLGGALISPNKGGVIILRDSVVSQGRRGITPLGTQPFSGRVIWDGRFWIDGAGTLTPAGKAWLDAPLPLREAIKRCPVAARASLPLWQQNGEIIAIGPYGLDGQLVSQVKSAVLPRLEREFA